MCNASHSQITGSALAAPGAGHLGFAASGAADPGRLLPATAAVVVRDGRLLIDRTTKV